MSVWTEVEGTISVHKSVKISMKESIHLHFDEVSIGVIDSVVVNDYITHTFTFNFCDDGMSAARRVNEFIQKIKNHTKTARIDISATIRYLV